MSAFLARRLLHLVLVLVLVSMGATLLLELTPGDPAFTILGETAQPDQVEQVHRELGLDEPIWERYVTWVADAMQGDLGVSYRTKQPVRSEIVDRLPVSVELAVLATTLALTLAIGLGVAAAHYQGRWFDRVVTALSSATLSAPSFLIALLLLFLFAVRYRIFPVTGWVPLTEDVGANLKGAFLPTLALALTEATILLRLLRSDMISTLKEDYIFAAHAKGMSRRYVLIRHALRPSSFSLLTVAGISLG